VPLSADFPESLSGQLPGRLGLVINLRFVRVADNTLGAHGVASSSNSARPAHFVGGVLNAVAPRIAQHVIEIRSARRNFGALAFRPESAAVAD
jgi:hypothetical protein